MSRRSGLGKGLGALIPNAEQAPGGDASLRELSIALVRANPYQPRGHFDDEALASLTASIRELGVLQPILVRPVGDHFELIAGERRWRAAQAAGLSVIPALVREVTDTTSLEQALVENLHREDLSVLEEAAAFQQLVDDFALSYEEIGQRVGKSRSTVANAVRLLQLPAPLQRLVNEKELSAGHARALLAVDDHGVQQELARRIIDEDLSVRATEEAVRLVQEPPAGDVPSPAAAGPTPGARPAGVLELEERLAEHLDTRVHIQLGGRQRGKIVISFAGYDDLDRLARVIQEGREPSL
jgi:ParB family transcriptional regulator, chromosome partitioning protein